MTILPENQPIVSLAPVQNALNTLALLTAPQPLALRSPGVREMLTAMTSEQRRHNLLLFDALGDSLMPEEQWASFPLYLEYLASRDPVALRNEIVERFVAQAVTPSLTATRV